MTIMKFYTFVHWLKTQIKFYNFSLLAQTLFSWKGIVKPIFLFRKRTQFLEIDNISLNFQSWKQLYNHKCLSVCSSITKTPQQLEMIILHPSSLIFHPSSFILHHSSSFLIHLSFILQLLSFSACLYFFESHINILSVVIKFLRTFLFNYYLVLS